MAYHMPPSRSRKCFRDLARDHISTLLLLLCVHIQTHLHMHTIVDRKDQRESKMVVVALFRAK